MNGHSNRIYVSLIAFVIWMSITVLGGRFLGGGQTSLSDSVSNSIAWNILAAALFLGIHANSPSDFLPLYYNAG